VKGSLGVHAAASSAREHPGPLLCTFGKAQTIGENALLASTASASTGIGTSDGSLLSRRPVTAIAQSDCILMRLNQPLFMWFVEHHPDALTSFVLTTTARQWRVAYYLLVEFLRLEDSWLAALEPPGSEPAFVLSESPSRHRSGPASTPTPSEMAKASPLPPDCAASDARASSRSNPVPVALAALRSSSTAVLLKQPGEAVYREGTEADALYVVLSGHAVCHVAGKSRFVMGSCYGKAAF
jgi:CRP-like cAMP-binding protein